MSVTAPNILEYISIWEKSVPNVISIIIICEKKCMFRRKIFLTNFSTTSFCTCERRGVAWLQALSFSKGKVILLDIFF